MQFMLHINQVKALEWGINAQQAMMFSFIYTVPSWAKPIVVDRRTFYAISKEKITQELPLLTEKPDTAYRILKALELVEVIELSSTSKITLVRLTEKGRTWNTSENFPSKVGKKSEVRSEKNPTNQDTNNQGTNHKSLTVNDDQFEEFWKQYPNKKAKAAAEKRWKKISPDDKTFASIMSGLARHKSSRAWLKDNGEFIPHPATWLNERRWEDEIGAAQHGDKHSGFSGQRDYTQGVKRNPDGTLTF